MRISRLSLAHPVSLSALALSALLAGACGGSHGRDDDAGSGIDAGSSDAGRGTDSGRPDDAGALDGGVDAGSVDGGGVDAGPRGTCDAEDARGELCPEVLCDGPGSWHWNGEACFYIDCGACRGEDCGGASRDECEAAHATCDAQLCRDTGGTWRWWDELCGHYECGERPPEICEVGAAGCDCDYGQRFIAGVGCQSDATACPSVDPLPPETLCASTGGTWTELLCCHTECGVPCDAGCAASACACGDDEVFHPIRGCEVGARCLERLLGESCGGLARCEGDLLCCDSCGGAGCAGEPTCRVPTCDDDPDIDMCGNNLLAP